MRVSSPLKIAIVGTNNDKMYSGGRYHALILAYALARMGAEVSFVTNKRPRFIEDLDGLAPDAIRYAYTPDFRDNMPEGPFDYVILVPTGIFLPRFYEAAFDFARGAGARMALINFESGNWFNGVAPVPRDLRLWDYWRRAVTQGGLVISSLRVSDDLARDFYVAAEPQALRFEICGPPINSPAANLSTRIGKDGSVVSFVRSTDVHKGGGDLLAIDPAILSGRTLKIISGGDHDPDFRAALEAHYGPAGVALEFHSAVSDAEKFELIGKAQALLFPSRFEGFGYPPVEAAYMGTESVCYDLPALRETVGAVAHMAPVGDVAAFGAALAQALAQPERRADLHQAVASIVDIDAVGYRICDILYRSLDAVPPLPVTPGKAIWGPFETDEPDAAVQSLPWLPATLQSYRATSAGGYLLSVNVGSAQVPASVALAPPEGEAAGMGLGSELAPDLTDVCISVIARRAGGYVLRLTGRLSAAPDPAAPVTLLLRDAAGETIETLSLKLLQAAPAADAQLTMTGLSPDADGGTVHFTVDGADRIALSCDGAQWVEAPVEAGRVKIALSETAPHLTGMRVYLFQDGDVVDYLAGCPPLPMGDQADDLAQALANCHVEIMNLTDMHWDRGMLRNPGFPSAAVVVCMRPPRLPQPGDIMRLGSGRLAVVIKVEDKGKVVNLHFREGLDAQSEAYPAHMVLVSRQDAEVDQAAPGGNWHHGVWFGQGPLSGRCVLLPDEAVAALGAPEEQIAMLGPDGEEIAVERVWAGAGHRVAWLSQPIGRGVRPGAFVRAVSSAGIAILPRDAGMTIPQAAEWTVADPAGRVLAMPAGTRLAVGDVLAFGREIRAVQAIEKAADATWVLVDMGVTAPDLPIRFATVAERADFAARQLIHVSLLKAPGHGKLAELAETYRRTQHVGAIAPIEDRPRVLFASVVPPDPADQGNRIVTRNFIRHILSLGFDVDLLLLGRVMPERLYKEFGDRVRVFSWPFPDWTGEPTVPVRQKIAKELREASPEVAAMPAFQKMLRDVMTFHPFFIVPDALVRVARALYRKHHYHSIVCNYTHMVRVACELAPIRPLPPVAIVTHDALSRLPLESGGKPMDTMYRLCDPEVERDVLDAVPGAAVLAISESERDYFREIGVTNPVELCEYDGLQECDRSRVMLTAFAERRLLFHASGNPMNRAAIDWFLDNCWNQILRAAPDATLVLCGAICSHVRPDTPRVEMHGIVSRDRLMEILGTASVAINPTLSGTGLKIKTVEAVCAGLPSVCLPAAIEGLEDVADRFCALEREPDGFAEACVQLLTDRDHWMAMRASALKLAAERFSEATIYGPVDRHMGWDKGIEARHAVVRAPYAFPAAGKLDDLVAALPDDMAEMKQMLSSLLALGEVAMASALMRKLQEPGVGETKGLASVNADLALASDNMQDAKHLTLAAIANDPTDLSAMVRLIDIALKLYDHDLANEAWEHLALATPGSQDTAGLTALTGMEKLEQRAATWRTTPRAVTTSGENRLNMLADHDERLGPGWSHMEEWGAWTDGTYVRTDLRFEPTAAPLSVRITGNTHKTREDEARMVRIVANGEGVGQFALSTDEPGFEMRFKLPAAQRDGIILEMMIDNPAPYRLEDGTFADSRLLGLAVHSIDIEQI